MEPGFQLLPACFLGLRVQSLTYPNTKTHTTHPRAEDGMKVLAAWSPPSRPMAECQMGAGRNRQAAQNTSSEPDADICDL